MSSNIQITASRPNIYIQSISKLHRVPSKPCFYQIHRASLNLSVRASVSLQGLPVLKYKQKHESASKYQQFMPVCLFGSKGKSESDNNGGSPWNAFEKAIGNFKKGGQSIEDVLRQQIGKNEFYDGGGSGKKPPTGGGGGGGRGDSSSGSEEEGLSGILDETLQVVLATIGFILLYVYIINGEEMIRLAKDYIKYLSGGSKSVRLRRAMYQWRRFYQKLTEKKEYDQYWLEKEILNTPTWWDHPDKYRRALSGYFASTSKSPDEVYDEVSDDEF